MKNRNPILAFILSFLVLGLGQVYNGQLKKGIYFFLAIISIFCIVAFTGVFGSFNGMVLGVSLIVLCKLLISAEAYRAAKKSNPYQLKPINKMSIYLLFSVLISAVSLGANSLNHYEAFDIPTPSMAPTLQVGDKIMTSKVQKDDIQLGDIVVFTQNDGIQYIGRILAMPNQQISVKNDAVVYSKGKESWSKTKRSKDSYYEYQEFESTLPNGKKFETKTMIAYLRDRDKKLSNDFSNVATQTVPPNKVFIMGDNRNDSMDSRMYGTIDISQINRKARYIFWSKTKSRIGKIL